MRVVPYRTMLERSQAVDFAEAQGETMIHDNFDVGGRGQHELHFETLPSDAPHVSTLVETLEELVFDTPRQVTLDMLVDLEVARQMERQGL